MSNSFNNNTNRKTNLILSNSLNSSISRPQSTTVFNKYENLILIDSLSTFKQMNNILLDQQSNIRNKNVCI